MKPVLVDTLYKLRLYVNSPIFISSVTTGDHEDESHRRGEAADVIFLGRRLFESFDLFVAASRFPQFTSIGLYTYWRHRGVVFPGMHLGVEVRDLRRYWIHDFTNGEVDKFGMTYENFRRLGLA